MTCQTIYTLSGDFENLMNKAIKLFLLSRYMCTWNMWKVCLQTFRNNSIRWKLAYVLRNLRTSRVNNSRNPGIKRAKFSGYCFYMKTNISRNFQICISVPLKSSQPSACGISWFKLNTWTFGLGLMLRCLWLPSFTLLRPFS